MKLKILRSAIAVLIVLCCATPLFAQLTISGPKAAFAGDLVTLSVNIDSDCGLPNAGNVVWNVIPNDITEGKYHVCNDGKTLVFASRLPGTYHFIVAANDGGTVTQVMHKVENVELVPPVPEPTPTPGPVPTPEPDPGPKPLPDPDYVTLGQWAADKAKELVKSSAFDREKKALAEAFLTTTKLIEDGTLTTGESARTKQRDNARKYLASVSHQSAENWAAWDLELAKKLAEFNLDDVAKIGNVYKEIGKALAAVPVSENPQVRPASRSVWRYNTRSMSPCENGQCAL